MIHKSPINLLTYQMKIISFIHPFPNKVSHVLLKAFTNWSGKQGKVLNGNATPHKSDQTSELSSSLGKEAFLPRGNLLITVSFIDIFLLLLLGIDLVVLLVIILFLIVGLVEKWLVTPLVVGWDLPSPFFIFHYNNERSIGYFIHFKKKSYLVRRLKKIFTFSSKDFKSRASCSAFIPSRASNLQTSH